MNLSNEHKQELISLAKNSIKAKFTGNSPELSNNPELNIKAGAFVTLHKNGQLRGCIGRIVGDLPLVQTINNMAQEAAFHDPRFEPVTQAELEAIDIEISVLSPLTPIKFQDVIIGTHGLLLKNVNRSGVFLPQVPVEQGWSNEEYMYNLFTKASIPYNEVTLDTSELFGFTATVF